MSHGKFVESEAVDDTNEQPIAGTNEVLEIMDGNTRTVHGWRIWSNTTRRCSGTFYTKRSDAVRDCNELNLFL